MKRRAPALAAAMVAFLLLAPLASAHPLGNFTVNRYSRLEVAADAIALRYVLDLAEIPTLQEVWAAGGDEVKRDGAARQVFLARKAQELAAGARLTVEGRPLPWSVQGASLEFLPGQADLDTMRVEVSLAAPFSAKEGVAIEYRDLNYPGRVGWREVVLRPGRGISLVGGGHSSEDLTDELRAYPTDATRPPLDVSSASAVVSLLEAGPTTSVFAIGSPEPSAARFAVDRTLESLTPFLARAGSTEPGLVALALAMALMLGALHALEPGHGKALVGSYLVGTRGAAWHALLLGGTVTLTHTAGVYALALVTLVAAQYVVPERLYPVLSLGSGLMVVAVGLSVAGSRLRTLRRDEPHHHGLGHHHHHGDGADKHRQGAGGSHWPIGPSGGPTLRSLLALGVSGGLLPCPAAIVVLLAAVSFHSVALGMALVAAFSVGLAAVLTGVGLLVVYGGRVLHRLPAARAMSGSRLAQVLPALSAVAVTLAGVGITLQAAKSLL